MQCAYSFKVFLLNYSESAITHFHIITFLCLFHVKKSFGIFSCAANTDSKMIPYFWVCYLFLNWYFHEVLISILLTSRCKSYMPLLQSLLALLGPACQTYPAIMVCILLAYILWGKNILIAAGNATRLVLSSGCALRDIFQWVFIMSYNM